MGVLLYSCDRIRRMQEVHAECRSDMQLHFMDSVCALCGFHKKGKSRRILVVQNMKSMT